MKNSTKVVIITVFIVAVVALVLTGAPKSLVRLQKIEFVLDGNLNETVLFDRIQAGLKGTTANLVGQNIWSVDLSKLLREIESDRRVQNASIYRKFPNKLKILVTPHSPVAAILDGHKFFAVAKDGSLLPPTEDLPDLPVLVGKIFLEDEKWRQLALQLLNEMPDDGLLARHNISEISFSKKEGLVLFLSPSKTRVNMGEDEFAVKAIRVERVLKYLASQNLTGRTIDARLAKKFVVKLRNAP